jgi:hypothetical protein
MNNDKYWIANDVISYIMDFLVENFPDSIIVREFNNTDIMILDKNLPIEIQSVHIHKNGLYVSDFEDNIKRQIEQNIEISGRCWLFFDKKFLNYLNSSSKQVSINMDWLYKLWKLETVKIFTITYDGKINEMLKEDWSFLLNISQTCKLSKDNDYRLLQKKRSIIFYEMLKRLGYTTNEISSMYNNFKINKNYNSFITYLRRKDGSKRELIYSHIVVVMSRINECNSSFCCMINNKNITNTSLIKDLTVLGLFERNDVNSRSDMMRIHFTDKYDIAKYFPGYIRNKELWDYLKTRWLDRNEFYGLVTGNYTFDLLKKQSSILDY